MNEVTESNGIDNDKVSIGLPGWVWPIVALTFINTCYATKLIDQYPFNINYYDIIWYTPSIFSFWHYSTPQPK